MVEFTVAGAMSLTAGDLVVDDDAFGGRQLRLVASMLLLGRRHPVPIERLTDALWPAGPPDQYRPALRGLVSKVRRLLSEVGVQGDRIQGRPGFYTVELPELEVDLESACSALDQARALLDAHEPGAAGDLVGKARAVLSRPVLPGVDADWAEAVRDTAARNHLDSLLVLGECRRRLGRMRSARSATREALDMAPLREDGWRQAMRIEVADGNAAGALGLFEELRGVLADELGTDPSRETQDLHGQILRDLPEPDVGVVGRTILQTPPASRAPEVGPSARPDHANPYVGLRTFEVQDAAGFFGREAATQKLLGLLARHRAVAVVGGSGVGKSSLVRAGVLPALARGAIPDADMWDVAVVTPGHSPLDSLASTVVESRPSGGGLDGLSLAATMASDPLGLHHFLVESAGRERRTMLLVIDQAEELFTVSDPVEADSFLDAVFAGLSAARTPSPLLAVVLTLRADFYEQVARSPRMARLLSRSQFVLPPLSGEGLQLAITEPARRSGVELEEGVLGRLVAESGTRPSGLPLLQHVLWELWERKEQQRLTLAALDALGGVAGALARHAEETWQRLDEHQRSIARRILLRAVSPSERGATAAPVLKEELHELAPTTEVQAVMGVLVEARLLTATGASRNASSGTQAAVLELAHEALFREWPRFRRWIDDERETLMLARRIRDLALDWEASDREPSHLLRGSRLAQVERQGAMLELTLTTSEVAFISASLEARGQAEQRRALRRQRERDLRHRANTRLRVGAALTAAEGSIDRDPELALLLALEVADDVRNDVTELRPRWLAVLHHGLAAHHLVARLHDCGPVLSILPDDRLVTVIPTADGTHQQLAVVDLESPAGPQPLADIGLDEVLQVAATSDGRRLAVGDRSGRVTIVDTDGWEVVTRIDGPPGRVGTVAVGPDSRLVAGIWFRADTRQLHVYDSTTETLVHEGPSVAATPRHEGFREDRQVAFSPDGTILAVVTGRAHGRLVLLDTATWAAVAHHEMVPRIHRIAYSPEGDRLGVAHDFGASIHDTQDLTRVRSVRVAAKVPTICWTDTGDRLVVVGHHLHTLPRDENDPTSRPILPDVKLRLDRHGLDRTVDAVPNSTDVLLGQRRDRQLQRWDLKPAAGREIHRIVNRTRAGSAVAWSPSGDRLAYASNGGHVGIRTVKNWVEVARFQVTERRSDLGNEPIVENLEFTPDGRDIIAMGEMGTLLVWDTQRSDPRHVRTLPHAWVGGDAATDRHGEIIAVGACRHLEIMDRSGTTCQTIALPDDVALEAVALSPDDRLVAATLWPTGTARDGIAGAMVWEWRSGDHVATLPVVAHNLSFHPADGTLAVSSTGETIVWDPSTDTIHHRLVGHSGWVQDVTHSPEGHTLATVGWDGELRLWDTRSGELQHHFTGWGQLGRVRFHPSRPWIAITEHGFATHVLTLDPDELESIARARVTRAMTTQERQQHVWHHATPNSHD